MNVNSKTPMALYKANLELVLRIGALLQESRQRWMQTGATSTNEAMQRTLAETERMLTTSDWSALSSMPGDEFWKSLRAGAGPIQGTIESAARSQAEFSEGVKQAFAEWQQQSADALGGNRAHGIPKAFGDLMQGFGTPSRSSPSTKDDGEKPKPKPKPKATPEPKAKAKARPSASTASGSRAKSKTSSAKNSRAPKPRKPAKK
jgi:hypothetical protein